MAAPDTARVTVNCVAGTSGPTGGQCWIAGTSLSICSGATAARCAAARHGRAAARGEGRSAGGHAALPTGIIAAAAGWSLAPTSRGGTRRPQGPAATAGRRICGLGRPPAAAAWAVAGRVHPPAAAAASGTGSGSDTAIVIIVRTARPLGAVLNAATTSAAATSGRRLLLSRPVGRGCYRTGVAALPIHAGRRRRRGRRRHLRRRRLRAARAHPAVAA